MQGENPNEQKDDGDDDNVSIVKLTKPIAELR